MTLLQTRLRPPLLRDSVTRPRLFMRLDAGLTSRLSLVSAPAGFGKTTLAAAWLATHGEALKSAWLALDESDGELTRFLAYFVAAWGRVDAHLGRGLGDALNAPEQPDAEAILTALLNDLAVYTEENPAVRLVMVLDDYHLIENPAVDSALGFFLEHLPPRVCLVMLTRIDPMLPLARLRARRHMTEIRERDLRFTSDETQAFLRDLDLSAADMHTLLSRTEGWIAGLQLAAVALRHDSGLLAELAGTNRYIMDYLADEVFSHQPEAIQRFLLETALLQEMCAPLCDVMREANDSQALLETLERANLFLVPLDAVREWYRYHHLFADLLRHRLRQTFPPDAIAALHRRASLWYADIDRIEKALYHAHAAGDTALLAAHLSRFGDTLWARGHHDTLRRWLSLIPEALWTAPIAILQAWLMFTRGDYTGAENALTYAQDDASGRADVVRAFLATFRADTAATIHHAESALSRLMPESAWRGSAAVALGDAHGIDGNPAAAVDAYREALTVTLAAGNAYLALNAGYKWAAAQRQRGFLHEAYAQCEESLALADATGLAQTAMAGCLYGLRGDILCEWNRLPEALAQTQQGIDASQNTRHVGLAAWTALYRARCLLAARDTAAVEAVLNLPQAPPWIQATASAMLAIVRLLRGESVAEWIASRGLRADAEIIPPLREFEYLVFARVLAFGGQREAALALITRIIAQSRARERVGVCVPALITYAALTNAEDALTEALALGARGGFVRAYLEGGAPILALLKSESVRRGYPDEVTRILRAFDAPPDTSDTVETLSAREQEVLARIAAGMKNQEIADALFISLNTVLYHTKNIYGKLGVTHRTQAVQRARELGLVG